MILTVEELARVVGGRVADGDGQIPISGAAGIVDAVPGQITFLSRRRYLGALKSSKATAVLVPVDFEDEVPAVKIHVTDPAAAIGKILPLFALPPVLFEPGVHPTAVIGKDVILGENVSIQPYAVIESGSKIGESTIIGAHVYIGPGTKIGANCHIYPHSTIREHVVIGNRVTIHAGVVVGSDGFGYEYAQGKQVKIPQTGIVQIDDDVEIGANSTIDRARFGKTWIGEGTKIDNLVQIAHNAIIGRHCLLAAQAGISGSSTLGDNVIFAGQAAVVDHIFVGDGAIVGAKAGVTNHLAAGAVVFGTPAKPIREEKEQLALINRLPKLFARVKKAEQILDSQSKSLPTQS